MPTNSEIKSRALNFLAEYFERYGGRKHASQKEFAEGLNIPIIDAIDTINALHTMGAVNTNIGNQYVELTPHGFALARQEDPSVMKSGTKNQTINFHGSVNQSALAFDSSNANVNLNQYNFLQMLAQEIEKNPDIPEEEKKTLLQNVQNLVRHPVVAGLAASLAGVLVGKAF
jgi:hypothetical protein